MRWAVFKRTHLQNSAFALIDILAVVQLRFVVRENTDELRLVRPEVKYKQGVNRYYKGGPTTVDADALLDVYGGIKVRHFLLGFEPRTSSS